MKSIVVIEDDAITRALLQQSLRRDGWRVLEAEDGETGLNLVVENRPAAVLCDLHIPRRNGFQVCRMLRAQPDLAGTKIIVTTGSRFGNDRLTALEAGADEYLVKPVLPADLTRVLPNVSADPAPNGQIAPPLSASEAVELKNTGLFKTSFPDDADMRTVVRFWGVRGSLPTPGPTTVKTGGNTSCVEFRCGDQIIILDAGTGIRALGSSLAKEFKGRDLNLTILISHTHWDHIQGFPFFQPAYSPTNKLRILGYESAVGGLRTALFEQMETAYFPISLSQMAGRVVFEELEDMRFQIGPVAVQSVFSNHPGICLAYRLTTPGGVVVYMCDHEVYLRQERLTQEKADKPNAAAIEFARREDEKIARFIGPADVLICDSQYDEEEYPSRLGWGHTCMDDTVALALSAGVKRLCLFHHDPDHDDTKIEAMVAHAKDLVAKSGKTLEVDAAREDQEIVLKAAKR
jgi:phosphoribosyl 1,2-cyclic phosphodiesterase/ActR/RegA family two-component response regulator